MRSSSVSLLACLLFCFADSARAAPPELILHNGKIVTVDEEFSIAEAIAIEDGRIAAVGADASIQALAGPRTRSIDLQGKTVLPGLIDTHVHASGASMYEFDHPVPEMETIADVLDYFRERAKVVPERQWIRLQQVFITRLRERRFPTREELDAAAARTTPVWVPHRPRTPPSIRSRFSRSAASIKELSSIPEGVGSPSIEPRSQNRRADRDHSHPPPDLIKYRGNRRQESPGSTDRVDRLRQS